MAEKRIIKNITFKPLKRNRFHVIIEEEVEENGKKRTEKYHEKGIKGITKNPRRIFFEKFNIQSNKHYNDLGVDLSRIGTPFNDQHKQGRSRK